MPRGWQRAQRGEGSPGSDGSVLSPVYLHDLGIVHRDVKVGDKGVWGGTEDGRGGGVSAPPGANWPPQRLVCFRWRTSSWMREVRGCGTRVGTPHPWGHPIVGGPHAPSHPAGHLKLADFGLSRHLRWGERAHTICGTLQYMGKGWQGYGDTSPPPRGVLLGTPPPQLLTPSSPQPQRC